MTAASYDHITTPFHLEGNLTAITRFSMHISTADTSPRQADSSQQQQRHARVLAGTHLTGLPLWRVEWAVLPGMQVWILWP